MKFRTRSVSFAVSATVAFFPLMSNTAVAGGYAPWLIQMGVDDRIQSVSNWGKNQLLGIVDSGIVENHQAFASGQVSASLSGCAAVSFKCSNGYTDDNSHGTAVAAIAAGNRRYASNSSYGGYVVTANSVISMAPNANIVAEKVMKSNGIGYTTDVTSGIKKAADAGASVINVSLGYLNTADLIQAINYAASKGSFVVWAGGNSAQALLSGASSYGLTPGAIQHLIFVGSVNAANVRSSFSNTPGTGQLINTSGVGTSYASRWVMTPGEGILAPVATSGSTAWGYWKGTSMSAPFASGALILLQSAWPILRTKGTAANLLLATARDLGSSGVDQVYGNGLVNMTSAFKPYGPLSVSRSDGSTIAVSSLTASMVTGGALGSLDAVSSKLSNYMAFDGYARNFSVNLSGLLKTPNISVTLNSLPGNMNTGPTVIKLADGGEFAYMKSASVNPAERLGVFALNPDLPQDKRIGYAMLTDRMGMTTAIGYGYPVQFAYAKALYGNNDIATLSGQMGASGLSTLAQGGGLFAYGVNLGERSRLAASWSSTAAVVDGSNASWNPAWSNVKASNLSVGLSHRLADHLTAAVNLGMLNENHGLLGSVYDTSSLLSLGRFNSSTSVGFSMGVGVSRDNTLLLEAGFATTRDSTAAGLLTQTTDVHSRSHGMTFMSKRVLRDNDRLTVAMVQPLRIVSGRVAMVMPSIDVDGIAHYNKEWLSLVPGGHEVEYRLSYQTPMSSGQSLDFQINARRDAQNVPGNREASTGVSWRIRF